MNATSSYIFPIIIAAMFHAAVVVLLLVTWESDETIKAIAIEKIYYIDANVVTENPIKAKQKREQSAAKKERERQRKQKAKKESERVAQVNRDRLDAEKVREEAERKAKQQEALSIQEVRQERDRQQEILRDAELQEQERQRMEESLGFEVINEQIGIRAVTDDEKAMAFVSQIQREIIEKWSRPPSARNGMQALLKVFLVPTGEVVNVTVVESSQNEAFDRSAINAVQKAERFVVPTDPRQFNRNFREFEVLFRPDDLRL